MRAKVMGRPSIVTDVDPPISWSSRGNTDAGPAPRQTFTVGTSWRMLLQAQRNSGKLRNEPLWKAMDSPGGGGKPCIQRSVFGSVSAAVSGVQLAAAAADMKLGPSGAIWNRSMASPTVHPAFGPDRP